MDGTAGGEHEQRPDARLVARLLREQVPELAAEGVRPSPTTGSSNWVFRVGDHYAARLPRADSYADDLAKEARWVPRLARELPVSVPDIVHQGVPSGLFPRPWTVVTWVPGDLPGDLGPDEQTALAENLGRFLRGLHTVDTQGQRPGAERWGYRCGEPVTDTIDTWAETAAAELSELSDLFDPRRVRRAWQKLRDVPPASTPPCWVHTDLSAENLLVGPDGQLVGVIDFGGLGVGDRSVDLLYAWSLFDQPAREALRRASGADEATWLRARAWAFAGPGLTTILSYRHSMPTRTARLTRMVEAVADEVGISLR
ncbi:MAG: aminoglycoside phosphotransferase family protein [Micropruina sp.]